MGREKERGIAIFIVGRNRGRNRRPDGKGKKKKGGKENRGAITSVVEKKKGEEGLLDHEALLMPKKKGSASE